MRRSALFVTLGAAAMLMASGAMAGPQKVDICHVPPGDPSDAHTISVSGNSVSAHLRHGDTLGPCPPDVFVGREVCECYDPNTGQVIDALTQYGECLPLVPGLCSGSEWQDACLQYCVSQVACPPTLSCSITSCDPALCN